MKEESFFEKENSIPDPWDLPLETLGFLKVNPKGQELSFLFQKMILLSCGSPQFSLMPINTNLSYPNSSVNH